MAKVDQAVVARPRQGRPRLEEAAEIDRRILDVAQGLFLQHGFGVSMNSIAEAAGLTRKTLYARYSNKEALFVEVLRAVIRREPADRIEVRRGLPVEQTLSAFILETLTVMSTPDALAMGALMAVNRDLVAQVRPDIVSAIDERILNPLQTYLDEANAAGSIAIDSVAGARALTTLLLAEAGRGMRDNIRPSATQLKASAAFLTGLFCHGVIPAKR